MKDVYGSQITTDFALWLQQDPLVNPIKACRFSYLKPTEFSTKKPPPSKVLGVTPSQISSVALDTDFSSQFPLLLCRTDLLTECVVFQELPGSRDRLRSPELEARLLFGFLLQTPTHASADRSPGPFASCHGKMRAES